MLVQDLDSDQRTRYVLYMEGHSLESIASRTGTSLRSLAAWLWRITSSQAKPRTVLTFEHIDTYAGTRILPVATILAAHTAFKNARPQDALYVRALIQQWIAYRRSSDHDRKKAPGQKSVSPPESDNTNVVSAACVNVAIRMGLTPHSVFRLMPYAYMALEKDKLLALATTDYTALITRVSPLVNRGLSTQEIAIRLDLTELEVAQATARIFEHTGKERMVLVLEDADTYDAANPAQLAEMAEAHSLICRLSKKQQQRLRTYLRVWRNFQFSNEVAPCAAPTTLEIAAALGYKSIQSVALVLHYILNAIDKQPSFPDCYLLRLLVLSAAYEAESM